MVLTKQVVLVVVDPKHLDKIVQHKQVDKVEMERMILLRILVLKLQLS